jgi:hypothetical protein
VPFKEVDSSDSEVTSVIKINYLPHIEKMQKALVKLARVDRTADYSGLKDHLDDLYDRVSNYPDRMVPLPVPENGASLPEFGVGLETVATLNQTVG